MKLKIELLEKYPWFRHESAMKQEGKGGQIKALASIEVDENEKKYNFNRIEIMAVSDHPTQLHSNLLRIGGKNLKKICKHKSGKPSSEKDHLMSPSAYKVILRRDSSDKMRIDTEGHESYLPENFTSLQDFLPNCVDNENMRFWIGGERGIELTGVTPYSKSKLDPAVNRTEEEILANGVHVQDVLKRRYKIDFCKSSNEECTFIKNCRDCCVFFDQQLRSKEEKGRNKRNRKKDDEFCEENKLETLLCNGDMYKQRLKVTCELVYESETVTLTAYSDLMFDRKRYGVIQIDECSSDNIVLTNASLQTNTIIFEKLDIPKSMKFEVQYVYVMTDESELSENDVGDEIRTMKVNDDSVLGVGPRGDVLKIFNQATSGQILNMAMEGRCKVFLKLKIVDNMGCNGGEANMELKVYQHHCSFDNDLHNFDVLNASISDHDMSDETNPSCFLCSTRIQKARDQFKKFSENVSKSKVVRRSLHSPEQQPFRKKQAINIDVTSGNSSPEENMILDCASTDSDTGYQSGNSSNVNGANQLNEVTFDLVANERSDIMSSSTENCVTDGVCYDFTNKEDQDEMLANDTFQEAIISSLSAFNSRNELSSITVDTPSLECDMDHESAHLTLTTEETNQNANRRDSIGYPYNELSANMDDDTNGRLLNTPPPYLSDYAPMLGGNFRNEIEHNEFQSRSSSNARFTQNKLQRKEKENCLRYRGYQKDTTSCVPFEQKVESNGITENLDGKESVLTKRFVQKNTEANDNLSSPDLVSSQQTHIFKRTNDKRRIDIINNFTDSCGVKNTNTKRSVGHMLRQKTRNRIMIAFTFLIILIGLGMVIYYANQLKL